MQYGSFLYLVFYVFTQVLKENLTAEQKFLKGLAREDFSKAEAAYLWARINDHKWYVSEKLGRDIGVTVAAVDFFENIHPGENRLNNRRRTGSGNLQTRSAFA